MKADRAILAWCRGVVRPMALGFAINEILGLITHDPLQVKS